MVKQILLTQGAIAFVSDVDADLVNLRWYVNVMGHLSYAIRLSHKDENGKWVRQKLHREVMERIIGRALGRREHVDHIDHNGLNNSRENLRIVNQSQNCANRRINTDNTSGYKGVSWNVSARRWCSYIKFNYKKIHLGSFDSKHDAARAYNAKALELFGQYARINVIDESK